jgi:hypothetical protein
MAATKSTIQLRDLSGRKLSALRRAAERQGITPEQYVKDLIDEELTRIDRASRTTFDEAAGPFREAFRGVSEAELDALVDAARKRRHRRQNSRRTRSSAR